jgi:predicted DNA-binding protein with PD1-like motif
MEHTCYGDQFFLRLDAGEELIGSLTQFAAAYERDFFAIVSGVGMVDGLRFGFFCVNNNDYDITELPGVFDLNVISGNISKRGGIWWPHVHLVVNTPDYATHGGHLIEATTHITMELWLSAPVQTGITRRSVPGRPASFLSSRS